MIRYLKFFLMLPVLWLTVVGIALGGAWMWTGVIACLILVVGGDAVLPDDTSAPRYHRPRILEALLYSTFPFLVVLLLTLTWMAAPGDPLGLGAAVHVVTGWDMAHARDRTTPADLIGGILSAALMVGTSATNVAHEFMHRRARRAAVSMSRWLLAFSYDVPLVISHVYGHHVLVATAKDHTSARRGESSYGFIVRSTVHGNLNAWRVEAERLRSRGRRVWSWHNRALRGYALSIAITAGFYWIGGWRAAAVFAVCALLSKSLLELINYIQHYGLLRVPGSPIGWRHSWNSNKRISSYLLCNVTRHAHHHVEPDLPFWCLLPGTRAPTLPYGYLTSILLALVPPLWYRHTAPLLAHWDAQFATPEERSLAKSADVGGRMIPATARTE